MTTKQKAKQLALTLVGEDQNPEPLIEVLMEMAAWQCKQMMKYSAKVNICIPYENQRGGYTQLVDTDRILPKGEHTIIVVTED